LARVWPESGTTTKIFPASPELGSQPPLRYSHRMSDPRAIDFRWLRTGDEAFATAREAMESARATIRFESYIYAPGAPGDDYRDLLVAASRRGVRVRVLVDAFGSLTLPENYWDPLREAAGEVRWFNRMSLDRFNFRNHRKLLACDETVAIVGGFNVAPVSMGDGVQSGWRDVGLRLTGPLVPELSASFDALFDLADFRHRRLTRFRKARTGRKVQTTGGELLLSGPGRGQNLIARSLRADLVRARSVRIVAGYFLPPPRMRRAITRAATHGGRVQLILAGQTDIPLMQAATRSLYQRLLRAGVELFEYQPQVLHTKLLLLDQAVYVGSSNLDVRSFRINYELMLRLIEPGVVEEATDVFDSHLKHSRRIERHEWRKSRNWFAKLKERAALFLFTRIDPLIARKQLRGFR
jgi:cardiolipin synthase A/B